MVELILLTSSVVGIAALILFIMVLVKLFQNEGVGLGCLGIICGLYTFIWGWTKHEELDISGIMWAWTACIIIQVLLSCAFTASGF